jgi:peptidoglycan LD-endopeptidase LytH
MSTRQSSVGEKAICPMDAAAGRLSIKVATHALAVILVVLLGIFCAHENLPLWIAARADSLPKARLTTQNAPKIDASPIAGLRARELRDSFDEIHHGHRHAAIDIMAPRRTPVHAVVDGTIRKLFFSRAGGNTVYECDRAQTYCYYYAHLDGYAHLHEGQFISRGDVLGYVGSTGNASPAAPHLHFAILALDRDKRWWKGTALDPYPVLIQLLQSNSGPARVGHDGR